MDIGSVDICQSVAPIDYIVYEAEQCRNERREKRYIGIIAGLIAIIIALAFFILQYDYASYTQDGKGLNNINTGTQEDVSYGATAKEQN